MANRLLLRYLSGAALLLAGVNEAGGLLSPGFSVADVIFQVPGRPWASDAYVLASAAALAVGAFGPVERRAVFGAVAAALSALALLSLAGAAQFYALCAAGRLRTAWPLPFSLLVAGYLLGALALLEQSRGRGSRPAGRRAHAAAAAGALGAAAAAIVFHIHAFGFTDYRRPADAILVLGARVYSDGRPSEALSDRMTTAVRLYRDGLSPRILVSGGVEDNGISESAVMKRMAMAAGVPEEAIVEDSLGRNTEASVQNAAAWLQAEGLGRVLAVSHYHHLPRIKLLSARRHLRCFTVPADEGGTRLRGTPYYVLREVAALAFYYLKG